MAKTKATKLPAISEAEFQAQVVELAKLWGWRAYHTFDSRKSVAGFPDLILIRGERLLAVELKTDKGDTTPEQTDWLMAFGRVTDCTSFLWKPAFWRQIEKELAR
jgi:Holliday junction resolvase